MAQPFPIFLQKLEAEIDSSKREELVAAFVRTANSPVVEGSTATILYVGRGNTVSAPSELNGWDPSRGTMRRVAGTRLFYRHETLPPDARLEYKLWVDSSWILDPLNPRRAAGGLGENSDVWMPGYVQSVAARFTPQIRRGRIDTLRVSSRILGRRISVCVYVPPIKAGRRPFPVAYVTDGPDYLKFGRMDVILDNLIASRAVTPLVAVFIDPKSAAPGASRDYRMIEYAASDAFVQFLEKELAPQIEERYHASMLAEQRLIMGVSMGGLQAAYAVLKNPEFVTNCAAQSPAFLQADSAVVKLVRKTGAQGRYFYIDAGTIGDTEAEATLVARELRKQGADVKFLTHHEGHNWTNWRARIPLILKTFFPRK